LFHVRSNPTRSRKFQKKNSIKSENIQKHHSGFISYQNGMGEAENEKNKISFRVHSYPTRFRKFQKNSIKVQKIKKYHSGFISSQKGTGEPENEKKNFRSESIPTQPDLENFKKIV